MPARWWLSLLVQEGSGPFATDGASLQPESNPLCWLHCERTTWENNPWCVALRRRRKSSHHFGELSSSSRELEPKEGSPGRPLGWTGQLSMRVLLLVAHPTFLKRDLDPALGELRPVRISSASRDSTGKGWRGTPSPAGEGRPLPPDAESPSARRTRCHLTTDWCRKKQRRMALKKASTRHLTNLSCRSPLSASKTRVNPQPISPIGPSARHVYSVMLETLYKTGCLCVQGKFVPKKQSGGNIWRHNDCLTDHINHGYTRKRSSKIPISVT